MKKILLASVLSAAFVSPAVFAQAKNFEGFGIQLSTGYQNNTFDYSDVKVNGSRTNSDGDLRDIQNSSASGMPLNLGVGYTATLNNNFTLGLLVEYNPLSMDAGTGSQTFNGISYADSGKSTGKLENQVSVSLVPGYAFTNETMGYAKVGWVNASMKTNFNIAGLTSSSANSNGYLLGLGVKQLFTKNIYGFAEGNYVGFQNVTSTFKDGNGNSLTSKIAPSSYSFLVGIGYKF
jgi:opacity protein-like surface antigen